MRVASGVKGKDGDIARDRIARLFRFVAAMYARRNPAQRQVGDLEWLLRFSDIPQHPLITLVTRVDPEGADISELASGQLEEDNGPNVILRCGRPVRSQSPQRPPCLDGWLGRDWEDCRAEPAEIGSMNDHAPDGSTIVVAFEDDPARVDALSAYQATWDAWAANERIALQAGDVFERLYALHGMLERDGERYELALGDATLVWARSDGGVRHPVLLRSMRLEFSADVPEFRIVDAEAPTEFYSSLFRSMEDVDGQAIGRLRSEAEALDLHPLGGADVDGFLRAMVTTLSPRGQFVGSENPGPEREAPVAARAPVFLLRRRTSGLARAIDAVVEDALNGGELPRALCNVVGKQVEDEAGDEPAGAEGAVGSSAVADANEDETILFTKPANAEQLDIARSLERNDCVLVQGPPGTGKTHTIGNLLGHLLAQGKSVLVVSHTTKALKVLRDKVVPQLQPLCVSVLDSTEDDAALKSSVEGIVERIGSADAGRLERDIARFESERTALVSEVRALRAAVLDARLAEQRQVLVGGDGTRPIDAAKEVAGGSGLNDWIPSPVVLGEPLPLTSGELLELYRTNASLARDDENAFEQPLPDPSTVPTPDRFRDLVIERRDLAQVDRDYGTEFWETRGYSTETDVLDESLSMSRNAVALLDERPYWTMRLVNEGAASASERRAWESLIAEIEATYQDSVSAREAMLQHAPRLAPMLPADRAVDVYGAIASDVTQRGSAPSFLTLLVRREWKMALDGAAVRGTARPKLAEEFQALATLAQLTQRRDALRRRWSAQVQSLGGPDMAASGDDIDALCHRYVPLLAAALDWSSNAWGSAVDRLSSVGFRWAACKAESDARYPDEDEVGRIRMTVSEVLPALFAAERARRRWNVVESEFSHMLAASSGWVRTGSSGSLRRAIEAYDPAAYRDAYVEINRLRSLSKLVGSRRELLIRLERAAPTWAAAVRARLGVHGAGEPPGNVIAAWRWRQFEDELNRRDSVSLPDLLGRLDSHRVALREATANLVDRRAWRAQLERTTLPQQQALVGFSIAKRRIGRGTGKRAATFARTARELLSAARSAVPVWIMPIVRAAEMFDPRNEKFDVVIVDEASQSDVTGLLAFYLGRQIIVVGDDEQVSPSAVGERVVEAQHLIDEFLQGIPNAQLYDGRQSLYDIAKQSFGGTICLLEHFRCVPDIIRFSNTLSYDGRIRPLREATTELPTPAVVPHRVSSPGADGKLNETEARAVASLVAAAVEQPEYDGRTFGVVSMVGDEQAYRIEAILRTILPPKEIESRRLLAGSAAHFQGDERNVMFLSMVQTGAGVPLPILQERMAQQRFNVAASRAQDQMWVVYSLDPATELKAGDLRRRLIEHALDPSALGRDDVFALSRAESPFEAEVIHRLSAAGYRVESQHWVGAFRIDIVVHGAGGTRLAVECDGDRYHAIEDITSDADRQAILERIGWTFARIRGSRFYRDPDSAMKPVFERLRLMGITPLERESYAAQPPTDLLTRVRARAATILSSMEESLSASGPLASWRRRSRADRSEPQGLRPTAT